MSDSAARNTILIVDDEVPALQATERVLRAAGLTSVATCNDSRLVMERLAQGDIATVILDLCMPHLPGEELLDRIVQAEPDLPVLVVTGANDVATAVDCIKRGAHDFILKPVERERLVMAVRRAGELNELKRVNRRLGEGLLAPPRTVHPAFASILTADPAMLAVFTYLEAVAASSQSLLVTGETGTGKELIARALHALSGVTGPLVAVNVAGLDDTMFADTLFGHCRGAYTGADTVRTGLVEKAAHGTLFLDEIGDLAPASQVKLLRLLQEREYLPLGCDTPRRSTARVVAATSRRLTPRSVADGQDSGGMRQDLYYRLQAHRVHLPPLRERLGDLRLLVPHFAAQAAAELGRPEPAIDDALVNLLADQRFPGNVRELRSQVFDAVSLAAGAPLAPAHFRSVSQNEGSGAHALGVSITFGRQLPTLKGVQDLLVAEALRRTGGNQAAAADLIGVSRQALHKRAHG